MTTTHDDTNSKFSNSQNITKKKRPLMKSASFKNKKREREKIIKLLRNNLKIKIPTGKRKSNAQIDSRLNINNIEKIIKKHTKERKDSFGNKITKENKKNVHISFKDKVKKKMKMMMMMMISYQLLILIIPLIKIKHKTIIKIIIIIYLISLGLKVILQQIPMFKIRIIIIS